MANYWDGVLGRRVDRRRVLAATGGVAASAAFLAACGGGDDESPSSSLVTEPVDTTKQAKRGGTLVRFGQNSGNLDPNQSVGGVSIYLESMYTRLIGWEMGFKEPSDETKVVGDQAESWEVSPDGLQITMKLRPGVRFHNLPPVNGRVVDADDVLFSWERFASTSPTRQAIANSANPNAPVLSFSKVNNDTIVIKLTEPISYALSYFGSREAINILPKEAADPAVLDLRSTYLGAGPYYLAEHLDSVRFRFKRHQDFWNKDVGFIDELVHIILPEYAAGAAQFRAGQLHTYPIAQEEVLSAKSEIPALGIYQGEIFPAGSNTGLRVVFGRRTPAFRDERVRQAMQMSWDRKIWAAAMNNTANFVAAGLPAVESWFSSFPGIGASFDKWRVDPIDAKAFGPNAKYYDYNIAEAKSLLAAAGFPNGIDVLATWVPSGGGSDALTVQTTQGMNIEAGFRFQNNTIPYTSEFIPKYRDVRADFEGIAYRVGPVVISSHPVDRWMQGFYSKSGSQFYGFDAAGRGDASGDPYVDETLLKARREVNVEAAQKLMQDLDRYLAPKAYSMQGVTAATQYRVAWPAISNFQTWRGAYHSNNRAENVTWWMDDTKAPLSNQ